jgi:hypothetical protein
MPIRPFLATLFAALPAAAQDSFPQSLPVR